jgi:hypothetical protein
MPWHPVACNAAELSEAARAETADMCKGASVAFLVAALPRPRAADLRQCIGFGERPGLVWGLPNGKPERRHRHMSEQLPHPMIKPVEP